MSFDAFGLDGPQDIVDYFDNLFNSVYQSSSPVEPVCGGMGHFGNNLEFTRLEILNSIKALADKSVAGVDHIPNNVVKASPEGFVFLKKVIDR